MSENYAELMGRITNIIRKGDRNGTPTIFTVHTMQQKKTYKCTYRGFFPAEVNDSVYAIARVEETPYGPELEIVRPPFVQIAVDRDSHTQCFVRMLHKNGVGQSKANRLYDVFATEAKSNDPAIVTAFIGELACRWHEERDEMILAPYTKIVSMEAIRKLLNWWYKFRSLRRLYLFGLTNKEIETCVKYGSLTHEKIHECCVTNPYRLIPLSIEKCDEILLRQNRVSTPEDRVCAQIVRKVYEMMESRGWSGVPSNFLMKLFPDLKENKSLIERLKSEYEVVGEYHMMYLAYPHMVEKCVAKYIKDLLTINVENKTCGTAHFQAPNLTDEQKMAIERSLESPLHVILGGAGTGKTTIIGEILHNLELRDKPYMVAAFTGRAVSRIREVVKRMVPMTLHRMISRASSIPPFKHLIIDEGSMVTTELFYLFKQAFPFPFSITIVGDTNQLPQIGWGSFFEQLIKCGQVPITRLTINHRVRVGDLQDGILLNANRIINSDQRDRCEDQPGEFLEDNEGQEFSSPNEFKFTQTDNFSLMAGDVNLVYDVVRLLQHSNIPSSEITIITPYNKDLDALNRTIQQIYNSGNKYVKDPRGTTWIVGDRVMMLENDYLSNLYNGSEGVVSNVDEKEIQVLFNDGSKHIFKLEDEDDDRGVRGENNLNDWAEKELTVKKLSHSFAVTVHRAQGSEWPYVIVYIPNTPANEHFLNRNFIYTSITRAKRAVWCIGDLEALQKGVMKKLKHRYENLALRIQT